MATNIPWKLSDLKKPDQDAPTVFSIFHCGGGSTMGYKLAGFNVLGGVEIDPEIMKIYRANHNPAHSYLMGVKEFNNLGNIPKELLYLDILDGSPPCSSFSMAGSREKKWGVEKKFREGQAVQVLDDLFFEFIKTAKKLQPKIVISENVKGLISGNAKGYVEQIFKQFKEAGYETQLFLLNASKMGVPQTRQRVFFISRRIDLDLPKIKLEFSEPSISINEAINDVYRHGRDARKSINYKYYKKCTPGDSFSKHHPKGSLFNWKRLDFKKPAPTITSSFQSLNYFPDDMFNLTDLQVSRLQSFPDDFNFLDQKTSYLCGMSVPPLMMERLALQVKAQLLGKSA